MFNSQNNKSKVYNERKNLTKETKYKLEIKLMPYVINTPCCVDTRQSTCLGVEFVVMKSLIGILKTVSNKLIPMGGNVKNSVKYWNSREKLTVISREIHSCFSGIIILPSLK